MPRTQIDPRQQTQRPHNRLAQYDQMYNSDGTLFNPDMAPQQQGSQRPPQEQQPAPQTSVPDLASLLSTVQSSGGGFSGPNFQLPGISGLSAGGGTQVGPSGITVTAPNQSDMYGSYMGAVSALGTGQQNLVGSIIANMLGLTGQLGTANISAGAQRDVAGIQGDTQRDVALTQAQSASDVANIQTQSEQQIEAMRQAGLITQQQADQKLAETNNAAQQRIAEIQAAASTRPAELQFQQFQQSMDAMDPFFASLVDLFKGGGIAGSSDSYQVDPQSLVNNAQAQNAQAIASQNRAGGPSGGAAANSAAQRAQDQALAAANAQSAYQIPLQANQQNFENRQSVRQNDLAQLSTLAQFIPSLFGAIS